ncbi:polysaccharide deacetylase family protein [Belliella marina]|uniref:Polysaccharide deacetylase family protein n=1 Tax=Belliella marina TaxID=1644146 RepID=A0ABW4VNL9_9BACT
MNHSILTISLDFELLWGVFDKVGGGFDKDYFLRTRQLIPEVLELFQKYGAEATWATVGMLFAENEEEWRSFQPSQKPTYLDRNLSAYHWVKQHGFEPACLFAPEIIKEILDCPGQELGSHTFAHYYTLSKGQTPLQFREDLLAAQRIAHAKFGLELKSLVFPRNHINPLYLESCVEAGFRQVRVNPSSWYWQETQHENLMKKVFRTLDCYINIGNSASYEAGAIVSWGRGLKLMPASRILKPIQRGNGIANSWKIHRVKSEMTHAAKNQEVYHLWWHPHNFAVDQVRALRELETILEHHRFLNEKYGMKSMSMQTFGDFLNK